MCESDHRRADRLVEELELKKGHVVTPSVRDSRQAWKKNDDNAEDNDASGGARPCACARQAGAGTGRARGETDFEEKQQVGQNIEKHGAGEESPPNWGEPRGVTVSAGPSKNARAKTTTGEKRW